MQSPLFIDHLFNSIKQTGERTINKGQQTNKNKENRNEEKFVRTV